MILRYIVLILALIAIGVWILYLIRCKEKWLYILAPLLWLINVAALWIYRLFIVTVLNADLLNTWSIAVYIHALITLIGAGVVMIAESERC